jgi:hypothetical protein
MLINRSIVLVTCLLLAVSARAQEAAPTPFPLPAIGDAVYKGVVGKALDAVPMDAEKRTILQRTNAIVSGTLTGRSLTAWAGLTNPVLLIAGVVWGIYSATNIKTAQAKVEPDTILLQLPPPDLIDSVPIQVTVLVGLPEEVDTYVAQ